MKRKIIAAFAVVLAPSLCVSADWEMITETASSDAFDMDFASIATVGKYRKAWVQLTYSSPKETNSYPKKSYLSSRMLYMFDCEAKMLGVTQSVRYEEKFGKGQVVDTDVSKFNPDRDLSDVVPDSVGESIVNAACGTNKYRAQIKAKNAAEIAMLLKNLKELEGKSPSARRAEKSSSDTETEL